MKIQDLSAVTALWKAHEYWSNALHSYRNNGYMLQVGFKNHGGTQIDLNGLLALDTSKDGALSALIVQGLIKQIRNIEFDLNALGVEVYEKIKPEAEF